MRSGGRRGSRKSARGRQQYVLYVRRRDAPKSEGSHKLMQTGSLRKARKVESGMKPTHETRIFHRNPSKQTQPSRSAEYRRMHIRGRKG